jgi:phage tail-like protein
MRDILAWLRLLLLTGLALGACSVQAQLAPERPSFVRVDTPEGASYFFRSVDGLKAEVEVIEVREGGGGVSKIPGQVKWPNLVLKRGFSSPDGFWLWSEAVRTGQPDFRKTIKISLIDLRGHTIAQFNVHRSFPAGWNVTDDNLGNRALEEFSIANEGVELIR